MKKLLLTIVLMLTLTLAVSAQEYWHLKTSMHAIAASPSDDHGLAYGYGGIITFGLPGGSYDIGFEVSKWWRTFYIYDPIMDELQQRNEDEDVNIESGKIESEHKQSGLAFSLLFRYRFLNLFSNYMLYTGTGGGFYFIQENREEARQNPQTGIYSVVEVGNYLDTKGQGFVFLGIDGQIFSKINLFAEGRFTYITEWDRWDDPYLLSGNFGLLYNF